MGGGQEQNSLILIPTYNEACNIKDLIISIFNLHPKINILIIDGNSNDDTCIIVNSLKEKYPNLHLFIQESKNGLGKAYICGFKIGMKYQYDYFISMDADFSHNPKYISSFLSYLEVFDVVIGSRNVKGGSIVGWNLFRKILSFGGSLYARIILGCKIMDFTGGFNAYTLKAIKAINVDKIDSNGYCFQIEMKYRAKKANLKIVEFPICFCDRTQGKSKMSKAIVYEAILKTLLLRFSK
ncbi:polyprenol monophosphomannose synthase [Helicobacter sp. MIT 99-5507]|uniref:polyprenol monophosphomannose synthase n=1 Tax=Helicobacter sp. MIT 99-5507 TaxID=152489 RepID=UPI000E1EF3E9|nr:polyprenol monophosphomannose synthase [Helicobacter sp. MIT 99-5507]RDU57556.1 dolichyl-phosphate beta-D-mannosyltransferase [Helicobacter sp. MIT 99-5507]